MTIIKSNNNRRQISSYDKSMGMTEDEVFRSKYTQKIGIGGGHR